ncbi:Gip4 [Kluyveromyces lactis]|nr:Gip4 [Kluyveromyces lactis]
MLAKAAASASSSMEKGSVYLDFTDIKCIQYTASIRKLEQLVHVCKVLLRNLSMKSNENLIPLSNFVIALGSGFQFNVSTVIEKRIELLSQFRPCKANATNLPLSTTSLKLEVDLIPVEEDSVLFVGKFYNKELQSQLLTTLQRVAEDSLQIYQARIRQLTMERNSNRPTDLSGRTTIFNEDALNDLLSPNELAFGLDLLANIRNRSTDTSSSAFFALALPILEKFKSNLNDKCIPPIRSYYTSIMKFSRTKGVFSNNVLIQLPYWQFTLHRIYAASLRAKCLIDVIRAVLRQIYIPNKHHFHDNTIKLHSENLHEYSELLEELETFCFTQELEKELIEAFKSYGNQNTVYQVQFNNISSAYQRLLLKSTQMLRKAAKLVDSLSIQWKNISDNMKDSKYDDMNIDEMAKMAEEKLAVDKLAYNEKIKEQERQREEKKNSSLSQKNTSSSSSITSNSSSLNVSPNISSPLRLSRTSSVSRSEESRSPSSPIPFTDAKSNIPAKKTGSVRTRNRSSSLQSVSSLEDTSTARNGIRSNSLQSGSLNTQRIVQNAYSKALLSLNEKRGPRLTPTKLNNSIRSKSPSPTVSRQNSVKQRNKVNILKLNEVDEDDINEKFHDLKLDDDTLIVSQEVSSPEGSETPKIIVSAADDNQSSSNNDSEVEGIVKKVRFIGVPPMSQDENPEPKRRGWYKKPAVLHYPPPPPQHSLQKFRTTQEGLAFRTSLISRDQGSDKKFGFDSMYSSGQGADTKIVGKIKDKLFR